MTEEQKQKENQEHLFNYRPFDIQWLDSCYQQTLLPDSPWQKVQRSSFDSVFTFIA